MTAADELRAAAAKIRETAAKAQAGPWVHHTREYYMLAPEEAHECVRTAAEQEYSVVALTGFRYDGIPETRGNAEHIALWNPVVAVLVANWLDAVAVMWDGLIDDAEQWTFLKRENRDSLRSGPWDARHALAIARAINGTEEA